MRKLVTKLASLAKISRLAKIANAFLIELLGYLLK